MCPLLSVCNSPTLGFILLTWLSLFSLVQCSLVGFQSRMEELENSSHDVLSEENGYTEAAVKHSDAEIKHSMVNGLSNGYDKEKKERDKHKEKHHEKDREKEKHRDKDSDREKHRSKDSDRDKHREKHKDTKDRDRDKDKHRDKDRDKERDKSKHSSSSSSKDKHSSSSSSKDKDKDRKDKERSKQHEDKDRKDKEHKSSSSSNKEKEHKSSSSSKHGSSSSSKPSSSSSSKDKEHRDKEHRDKERDKEKDKSREKERDKERSKEKHSSSSSSKDKERHSSDKHKYDKDKHSSSSSKDKDRHSSDKKDKHKEKDRDKEKCRDKEKEREKEKERILEKEIKMEIKKEYPEIKLEPTEIKEEKDDFELHTSIKDESMDDDDDGKLLIKEEATDDESKMDFTENSIDTSAIKTEIKEEVEDEDDVPMAARMAKMKRMLDSEDEDDVPLSARKKPKKQSTKKRKKPDSDYDDEEDFKPVKKKQVKKEKKEKKAVKEESITESPKKKKKKEEEEQEVWKWWEEEKKPDGVKWNFLEHKGPVFAPLYEPLPPNVKFYYDGQEFRLSEPAEEVATFYARMLDHDYTTKEAFNTNFMSDWRKVMNEKERSTIKDLKKCNFKHMHAYFLKKSEERKAMSKEEKKAIKEENEKVLKEYGFCSIDGHKEKIGNFKIEPPGLFRGRGEHPKMGKHKKRVVAEDIIINCSKGSVVPPPPPGHRWKEVRHDNSVTWLASWTENVQGQVKYIMLNPSSKLKGEKDWQKYETARKLAKSIDKIRQDYVADWKSKEMRIRQRAVAMYFIDKLALRAGNEKDEDQADTVGCCSLRVEHIQLHEKKDGKENVVVFDFLGKDSIRYYNEVPVEKRVFKNLVLFMENKKGEDDLFDRLNTAVLNKHLSDLMEGLTAKVFRTYNASWTLQGQLKELTDPDSSVAEKLLSYNRANRAVAILCNHQRAVPKTHDKSMANLREKLANKRQAVEDAENNYKHAKRDAKNGSAKEKIAADKAKKTLDRLREQLLKLEVQETDKEENKCIALGTSKLNYLDPRISVAWCKKYDVPIDKIYNKTQRDKFRWAIDMATADYVF